MVSGYAVDPGDLQRCDAAVGSAAAGARAALGPVRAAAYELLGTGWCGGAASAFRLGWEQWLEGAGAMLDALDSMAVALGRSGRDYAAADEAVRVSVARVSA